MANAITSTTQLSTFSTIKDILLTSTLLSNKFRKSDFYEFEPKRLGHQFSQVPYIVINVPTSDEELLTLDQSTSLLDMDVEIELVMDYEARSNFSNYASAILDAIRSSRGTLEVAGYSDATIDFNGASSEILDKKSIVAGTFTLTMEGYVCRN